MAQAGSLVSGENIHLCGENTPTVVKHNELVIRVVLGQTDLSRRDGSSQGSQFRCVLNGPQLGGNFCRISVLRAKGLGGARIEMAMGGSGTRHIADLEMTEMFIAHRQYSCFVGTCLLVANLEQGTILCWMVASSQLDLNHGVRDHRLRH